MPEHQVTVVGGVDTHRDDHVAATIDSLGRLLGVASFPATGAGYGDLLDWMRSWGDLDAVGVEGTGSYGAGLARRLAAGGVTVVEVIRPNRQARRRRGKSDPADAEAAARAVLCGVATVRPKSADGPVEAIRLLHATRRSAVKARTQAINQLKGHLVTVPEQVAAPLRGLATGALVDACARLRPNPAGGEVVVAAKQALRVLARRYRALSGEISELDTEIARLCAEANPALLAAPGVGIEVAATLLIAAGDNPERLTSEASFAALCGASPVEASSGRTVRHRLNRGGDRQANNALWASPWSASAATSAPSPTPPGAQHKASPAERSSGASNATSHERSTNCSPTPQQCPQARTCAGGATTPDSPSKTPQQPSTPNRAASPHSNAATNTTSTSPPATNTGSPTTPLDKHRSIVSWRRRGSVVWRSECVRRSGRGRGCGSSRRWCSRSLGV